MRSSEGGDPQDSDAQNRSSEDRSPQDTSAENRSSEDCSPQDSSAENRSSEDSGAQNTRGAEAQNARNQHAGTVYGAKADDLGGSAAAGAGTADRGGLPDQAQTRTERLISCWREPRILHFLAR
jgi:hypothetical protein